MVAETVLSVSRWLFVLRVDRLGTLHASGLLLLIANNRRIYIMESNDQTKAGQN